MRSMTGCGRAQLAENGWECTVELRSVNHRFLDLGMRLPRGMAALEDLTRKQLAAGMKRGHMDVFATIRSLAEGQTAIQVDGQLASAYVKAARELAELTGCDMDMTVSRLMQQSGVIQVAEAPTDDEALAETYSHALTAAMQQLDDMRLREGENLRRDLSEHLDAAAALREQIAERAPGVVEDYRTRLQARLAKMQVEEVDPARLAQEVALMADKCAIDEELSRLSSHIQQMRLYLEATQEIGKKMDFLIQEMNREANTIGSKASDAQIAQLVVNLKSEIEKLREQVQNVE